MARPPIPGERFGPYLVESIIGEGGMGTVYRARDTRLDRVVALKVMKDATGDASARFMREARVGASLSHRDVATVYETGVADEVAFIAMEWVDGLPLRKAAASMSTAARIELLILIAEVVAFAHDQNVLHRDLKPGNVLVTTATGRPKLLDFGIAKRTHAPAAPDPRTFVTAEDIALGTPSYMAPEQHVSVTKVDARADQFSWAVLAYEVLAGVHPRMTVSLGSSPFPVGVPEPLGTRCADVPPAIVAAIHKAMAFLPEDRFPSMRELLGSLRGPEVRAADTVQLPPRDGNVPKKPRRNRSLVTFGVATATVLLVGLVVGAGVLVWSERRHASAPVSVADASASSALTASSEPVTSRELEPPIVAPPVSQSSAQPREQPSASARRARVRAVEIHGIPDEFGAAKPRLERALAERALPCFREQSFRPGIYVAMTVKLAHDGSKESTTTTDTCLGSRKQCGPPPWVSAAIVACVEAAVDATPFPPTVAKEGMYVRVDVAPLW